MRVVYIAVVVLAALIVSSTAIQSELPRGIIKRHLRNYDMGQLNDVNEERMNLNLEKLERMFPNTEAIVDSKRVDEIFGHLNVDSFKINKEVLDSLPGSKREHFTGIFSQWMDAGISPGQLTELFKSDEAIEKKYRWVYTVYKGFVENKRRNK
ncbi:Avirulence protein (Avh) [Phytophthora palmivora]|uniref:Avirulence protein (Avh) n=1 Tax=Phytophthora palmivora TaxID=4796 RepID=A0A2P4X8Y9_9STRA|nr:Avirulence protein (Avh) [Phytophthora palmivora]